MIDYRGDETMLTTKEVAERLRIDVRTVQNLINENRLKAVNVSVGTTRPRYRVKEEDLETFINESEVKNERTN